MNELLNDVDKIEWVNNVVTVVNSLHKNHVNNIPCLVFIECYIRNEYGKYQNKPLVKILTLNKFSEIEQYKQDNKFTAYQIKAIVFFNENVFSNYKNPIQFSKVSEFKKYFIKHGMYFDSNYDFFRKHVEPYNNFFSSWFIESEEDSDF